MEPDSTPLILTLLKDIGIPFLTLLGGWFGHLWRTKQKKEQDILANVQQILQMQKQYITEQDEENKKTRDMNSRLEKKLDDKRRSIRQANYCKFTNEGEGCPVLNHEEKVDGDRCETCKYNAENADS